MIPWFNCFFLRFILREILCLTFEWRVFILGFLPYCNFERSLFSVMHASDAYRANGSIIQWRQNYFFQYETKKYVNLIFFLKYSN